MWDLPAAEEALRRLEKAGAPGEALTELRGRIRFFEGDYTGAAQLLKGIDTSYAPLAEATRDETATYEVRESEHFSLRYPPGKDALLALYALDTLEAARTHIGEISACFPRKGSGWRSCATRKRSRGSPRSRRSRSRRAGPSRSANTTS